MQALVIPRDVAFPSYNLFVSTYYHKILNVGTCACAATFSATTQSDGQLTDCRTGLDNMKPAQLNSLAWNRNLNLTVE